MKNKFLLILYFFISISLNSVANENKFEVSNIELENSGKIIIANNGKYTSKDGKFEVVANKFIYNKEESLLSIFEGEAKNKFDGLKIKFDKFVKVLAPFLYPLYLFNLFFFDHLLFPSIINAT